MRQFLVFTLAFEVLTATVYLVSPPQREYLQWLNLMLGYYIGALAMRRFR